MNIKYKLYIHRFSFRAKKNWMFIILMGAILFFLTHIYSMRNDVLYFLVQPSRKFFIQNFNLFRKKKVLIEKIFILEQQNKNLRKLLYENRNKEGLPVQCSSVVHYLDNNFNRHLIIRKMYDGIYGQYPVLNSGNLVGQIIEEGRFVCRVRTILDMQSKIPVYIKSTGQEGILMGYSQRYMCLDRLKNHIPVHKDQILYTSGKCGIFPRNIPVGRIAKVGKRSIYVEPIINITELDDVFIPLG